MGATHFGSVTFTLGEFVSDISDQLSVNRGNPTEMLASHLATMMETQSLHIIKISTKSCKGSVVAQQ